MHKLFIELRKRLILPRKWARQRREFALSVDIRPKDDILAKMDEIRAQIVVLQRLEDKERLLTEIGKLAALKWVIYGKSK